MKDNRKSSEPPDGFLRDSIETFVRPVLQDLAQKSQPIPAALIQALAPRYTITSQLGQGGMASVYLAVDQTLHRTVAVKVLQPDVAERFLREIEITILASSRSTTGGKQRGFCTM